MAKKSGRDDVQLEEISKLQTELAQLQADLMDSVNINDELSKVIIVKDEEIQDKAERLVALKEQNEADGEQLELEQLTLSDRCQYEISTKEETLRKLGLQHKRFRDTSEENAELKVSVRDTGDRTEVNGELHATTMHLKNLEMKTLREVMERKMRDQLNKMDISYQKEAFAALSEVHKKSMFQNAKLKDEVALQGVGLNNLGTRLAKQNQKYTLTRSELHSLHVKSRALKEALGKITGEKRQLARDKE
ncbi:hypothetical protein B484DRAFT_399075 [Ochromonadaceae sp. CCMP2298]|nr:hypothetical protein B484DRAFT_399075 [Ochromonadaceae sp. CCMP2298]